MVCRNTSGVGSSAIPPPRACAGLIKPTATSELVTTAKRARATVRRIGGSPPEQRHHGGARQVQTKPRPKPPCGHYQPRVSSRSCRRRPEKIKDFDTALSRPL